MQCKLSIVLDVIIEKGSSWLNSTGCLFKAFLLRADLMIARERERDTGRKRGSYIMTGIHNRAMLNDNPPPQNISNKYPSPFFFSFSLHFYHWETCLSQIASSIILFPSCSFFLLHSCTENILNHVSFYTVYTPREISLSR